MTKLAQTSLDRAHAQPFFDALTFAMGAPRRLHHPEFRDAFVVLFTAVLARVDAFQDSAQRTQVCLWATAACVYNIVDAARATAAPGLTEDNFNEVISHLELVVEHLCDAHIVALAAQKAANSPKGKRTAPAPSVAVAAPSLGPPPAVLKARLFDCFKRCYEGFKQPWLGPVGRARLIDGVFVPALRLPAGWWPQGRLQRTQLERWMNTMQARR